MKNIKVPTSVEKVSAVAPTFVEPDTTKLKVSKSMKPDTSHLNNITNWSIFPGEADGQITAINNRTMEKFSGTIEAFNETYVRGV